MYILPEDYEHVDWIFNNLDHETAHDFMDQLLSDCSKKSGIEEKVIDVVSPEELAALRVDEGKIITLKMVYDAYRAVIGGNDE